MEFLDLFVGNSQDFCLETLMKTPCSMLVNYVVANKMIVKAYTMNRVVLNRSSRGLF